MVCEDMDLVVTPKEMVYMVEHTMVMVVEDPNMDGVVKVVLVLLSSCIQLKHINKNKPFVHNIFQNNYGSLR